MKMEGRKKKEDEVIYCERRRDWLEEKVKEKRGGDRSWRKAEEEIQCKNNRKT